VPIDVLRSLYLRPHYVFSAGEANSDLQEAVQHAKFTQGTDYQSKSIYHPDTKSISYTTLSRFPPVKLLPPSARKRVLVTGGAGFVGSHLVDRLMLLGHEVTVIDNFFTGSKTTVSHWIGHPNFEMVRHDVVEPFMIECDREAFNKTLHPHTEFSATRQRSITWRALHPLLIISSMLLKPLKLPSWGRSTCWDLPNAPRRVSSLAAHPVRLSPRRYNL
jgi:UDP-glucuronate decarboxylase